MTEQHITAHHHNTHMITSCVQQRQRQRQRQAKQQQQQEQSPPPAACRPLDPESDPAPAPDPKPAARQNKCGRSDHLAAAAAACHPIPIPSHPIPPRSRFIPCRPGQQLASSGRPAQPRPAQGRANSNKEQCEGKGKKNRANERMHVQRAGRQFWDTGYLLYDSQAGQARPGQAVN
ncbi:hypothetical protein BS50DRAFT_149916 [Corynespora cassiicola Philippines]|uniref:Uncharacterized protein n=1 Tax=Corynespora cassiicola Philippines TaxID=1448308 RepID=A0A2T2N7I8_CORCC|nr:hypothetical protein BS50DRAFT_149916 [Corynespora cassiicola Philippines]